MTVSMSDPECHRDLLKTSYTHKTWYLSTGNVDSRARHEATDGRCGNELHDPSESEQTNSQDNKTADEGDSSRNRMGLPYVGM